MNEYYFFGKLHREIYYHIKKKALSYESNSSIDFSKYKKDYLRFCKRSLNKSTINELIQSILRSRVIFLGDFHAFEQSTRNMKRIIDNIIKKNDNLAIGLECIYSDYQKYINKFLKEEISEETFLKKTKYMKNWRYPWTFYKYFFDLAKKNNIPIIALNSLGSLQDRDVKSAQIISSFIKKNPHTIMFVVFGEYHITPDKLPLQVRIRLNTDLNYTIVHQNLDHVFWNYQKEFPNKQQIFKFNDHEYTLQSSPPWIKYESMSHWYESILDDPDLAFHESAPSGKFSNLSENNRETFFDFAKKISGVLGIDLTQEELADFNLYDQNNLTNTLNNLKKIKNKPLQNFYIKLLTRSKSFKVPFKNDYYCPSYSINRLAYLAGIHVLHQQHYKINSHYEKDQLSTNQQKKFYFFLYRHIISYFSSKIINPFRKCDYYLDIEKKLSDLTGQNTKRIYLRLSLSILDDATNIDSYIQKRSLRILSSMAKLIGYLLGEYLFEEIMQNNQIHYKEIMEIILKNQNSKEHFIKIMTRILNNIDYKTQQKRFF